MLPPLADEPRLDEAIDLFNRGEYEEAADIAEELFFEATGGERPFARVLLQLFVAMVHVQQGQTAPALERLEVGIEASADVRDWYGLDGRHIVEWMHSVVRQIRAGGKVSRPRIERRR